MRSLVRSRPLRAAKATCRALYFSGAFRRMRSPAPDGRRGNQGQEECFRTPVRLILLWCAGPSGDCCPGNGVRQQRGHDDLRPAPDARSNIHPAMHNRQQFLYQAFQQLQPARGRGRPENNPDETRVSAPTADRPHTEPRSVMHHSRRDWLAETGLPDNCGALQNPISRSGLPGCLPSLIRRISMLSAAILP